MTIQEKLEELLNLYDITSFEDFSTKDVMLEFAQFCCEEQKKVCAESLSNITVGQHNILPIEYTSILNCKNVIS